MSDDDKRESYIDQRETETEVDNRNNDDFWDLDKDTDKGE